MSLSVAQLMRGAGPIVDPDVLAAIRKLPLQDFFIDSNPHNIDPRIRSEYLDAFPHWIASSRLNSIDGLDAFKHRRLTAGITQSFDDFIFRHRKRQIKILPGEYPYAKWLVPDWKFLDEVDTNDAIIMSAPFSATGELHPDYQRILDRASRLQVPVLIDCAFFGICRQLHISVNYPCIDRVCFSLSKAFASGSFRSGIEFGNDDDIGAIAVQNKWEYLPLLSAKIGLELMGLFSPDYIFTRYRPMQLNVCNKLRLTPVNTVIFGLGGSEYSQYSMDGVVNRCGITSAIRDMYDSRNAAKIE